MCLSLAVFFQVWSHSNAHYVRNHFRREPHCGGTTRELMLTPGHPGNNQRTHVFIFSPHIQIPDKTTSETFLTPTGNLKRVSLDLIEMLDFFFSNWKTKHALKESTASFYLPYVTKKRDIILLVIMTSENCFIFLERRSAVLLVMRSFHTRGFTSVISLKILLIRHSGAMSVGKHGTG